MNAEYCHGFLGILNLSSKFLKILKKNVPTGLENP